MRCRCLHFRFITVHSFADVCIFKMPCLIMKVLVCNLCLTRIKRKQGNFKSGILISLFCQFHPQMWIHLTGGFRSRMRISGQQLWHFSLAPRQRWRPRVNPCGRWTDWLVIAMDFPPRHVTTSVASRHRFVCQTSLAATALAGKRTDGALGSMVTR